MSDCLIIGFRLMLHRIFKNRKKSANRDVPVAQPVQEVIQEPENIKMDLLTLPDEMIASTLKYLKFVAIAKIRKINAHIDEVAVAYGISKPKIFFLNAHPRVLHFKYKNGDMVEYPPRQYSTSVTRRCRDTRLKLEEQIENSRGVRRLEICDIRIDDEWLNLLEKIKQKRRVRVVLNGCYFEASLDEMKQVLGKFGSVQFIIYAANIKWDGTIATDEVLCSLMSFAHIEFLYKEKARMRLPTVTDETLKELQRVLPNKFFIGNHFTGFSIAEVIQTIKARLQAYPGEYPYRFHKDWSLGNVKAKFREEMLKAAKDIEAISKDILVKRHATFIDVEFKGCTVKIALE